MASIIETHRDKTITLVIVIPLIIFGYAMFSPHLTHAGHVAHIVIHEAGMLIAGCLLSMTIIAYFKTKLPRMLFSAAAFAVLTLAQGLYLFLEQNTKPDHHVDFLSSNEIFDVSIVIMTILFALGVFYNSRKLNNYK